MSEPVKETGLFASVRRLLATALEMAQVRLDLFSTELELEKRRLFDGLVWGAAGLLAVGLGLVLLCGFVTLLFWEGYRLAAVGAMTLLFLGGGALLLRESRQRLRSAGGAFSASVKELERDRAGLQAPGHHDAR